MLVPLTVLVWRFNTRRTKQEIYFVLFLKWNQTDSPNTPQTGRRHQKSLASLRGVVGSALALLTGLAAMAPRTGQKSSTPSRSSLSGGWGVGDKMYCNRMPNSESPCLRSISLFTIGKVWGALSKMNREGRLYVGRCPAPLPPLIKIMLSLTT